MSSLQLSQPVDERRLFPFELILEIGKRFLPFVQGEENGSPTIRANRKAEILVYVCVFVHFSLRSDGIISYITHCTEI
jgi:hypothetical protein